MASHLVLLVEDDLDTQEAVEELLRAEGLDVVVAVDGAEALEILRSGADPCLILLDVMMPRKDGYAFRAEQLADPVLARIPVVVFSGAFDVATIARQLGVGDYVTKPIDVTRMLGTVRRYCADAPQP